MDKLWAPWRVGYLYSKKKGGCIFCDSLKSKKKTFVILKNKHSFAVLNKYPYNNGHVLVAPLRHTGDISGLKDEEILDLFKTLVQSKDVLIRALKPAGFNIGINIGEPAGAGITGHLHIHIVPRWKGDTNFMPVVYNTKIISQSLEALYNLLKKQKKQGRLCIQSGAVFTSYRKGVPDRR
jgi:ATP adenylyltransferase